MGAIVKELVGLFVDDEFLAAAILVIVASAAALAFLLPFAEWSAGLLMVVTLPAALAAGVWRSSRRAREKRPQAPRSVDLQS